MNKKRLISAMLLIMAVLLLGGCGSKSAGSYHKEGLEYFSNGNYEKAEASLAKAIQMNGDRADYYIDYAMTLVQLKRYEEALQNLNRAILDKDNSIVNKNNKLAYRAKGITYFKSHDYKKAIEQFDKALAINELRDLDMDILSYKGNSQAKSGLFDEAVKTYTDLLKSNPSDAYTYYSRAYGYRMLKSYDKSQADYDKAIKLDNKNYDYYFGKYFLLIEKGDKDNAEAVLKMASNIKGTNQEDNFNLAKVHYYMGNYEDAIREFSEAFKNGFAESYFFLGSIYEQKEDYDNAVYNYSMYIKEAAYIPSAAVYNQIAYSLIKVKNYDEALSYLQTGLKYNDIEYEQSMKRNEIVVYENMGDYEKANALMKDYLKVYTEDEEAKTESVFIKNRLPEASTPHKE
ncbi:tetratricopeptide repeat protein [Anaerocolumna sp. AGMB13025]|uniref:tetratricopeptide repeat protein n=1 Tax=Anaerocolumna sp. AGMB13025 TaxID=3039116 RepID=UPI00241EA93D|nr:tetratricopeptide repeat protein [Anaerocolumna sp. AGMB13025]WFR59367.1 tetratricopeptide repeat protein [Anaerocolumna sp. AGMB13025]